MQINERFAVLADDASIEKTIEALRKNGMEAVVVNSGEQAKDKLLEILPAGAEIMAMTSITLEEIGVVKTINESGNYDSVRNKLNALDRTTQAGEMQKLGAAPEWVIGSVHAVTKNGQVVIASKTGSQLPAYVYGSAHVIWVVGAQKIVKNIDDAMKRVYEYALPMESQRALEAYGVTSGVSKLLTINEETTPGRITMIIVKEKLGF